MRRLPSPPGAAGLRQVFSNSRTVARLLYRDPEHIPERLTLYAVDRLAVPSQEWARAQRRRHPDASPAELAEALRGDSARVARIDGAIAGTPFLLALVPGYVSYLWQEMRMTLRIAALHDRDPAELRTAAEMLTLRGVHADVDGAAASLDAVRRSPVPERPSRRRGLRMWVRSVRQLLVLGGFLSPPSPRSAGRVSERLRAAASLAIGALIWVVTWVFPVTFMIAMAWGCESHTRSLGRRAVSFYDPVAVAAGRDAAGTAWPRHDHGHHRRAALRAFALFASVAAPIAFVAYVDHVRNQVGLNWLGAVGALVALSLVIATAVVAGRGAA